MGSSEGSFKSLFRDRADREASTAELGASLGLRYFEMLDEALRLAGRDIKVIVPPNSLRKGNTKRDSGE